MQESGLSMKSLRSKIQKEEKELCTVSRFQKANRLGVHRSLWGFREVSSMEFQKVLF